MNPAMSNNRMMSLDLHSTKFFTVFPNTEICYTVQLFKSGLIEGKCIDANEPRFRFWAFCRESPHSGCLDSKSLQKTTCMMYFSHHGWQFKCYNWLPQSMALTSILFHSIKISTALSCKSDCIWSFKQYQPHSNCVYITYTLHFN